HLPRGDVDDVEGWLRETVTGDDQVFRIGSLGQVQRHVADLDVLAGGLDPPAVGQQRRPVRLVAGQRGRQRRDLRERAHRGPGRGGHEQSGYDETGRMAVGEAHSARGKRRTDDGAPWCTWNNLAVSSWGSDLTE